jgi:hypothetical protein
LDRPNEADSVVAQKTNGKQGLCVTRRQTGQKKIYVQGRSGVNAREVRGPLVYEVVAVRRAGWQSFALFPA